MHNIFSGSIQDRTFEVHKSIWGSVKESRIDSNQSITFGLHFTWPPTLSGQGVTLQGNKTTLEFRKTISNVLSTKFSTSFRSSVWNQAKKWANNQWWRQQCPHVLGTWVICEHYCVGISKHSDSCTGLYIFFFWILSVFFFLLAWLLYNNWADVEKLSRWPLSFDFFFSCFTLSPPSSGPLLIG